MPRGDPSTGTTTGSPAATSSPCCGRPEGPCGDSPGPGGRGLSPALSGRDAPIAIRPAHLDEAIEERRAAAHIRQGGGRRAVDVRPARDVLVPVDPGGDGDARPDGAGQGDPRPESPAIVEDLGPVAVAQAAACRIFLG